jgi:hypothetical protein
MERAGEMDGRSSRGMKGERKPESFLYLRHMVEYMETEEYLRDDEEKDRLPSGGNVVDEGKRLAIVVLR